MTPEPHRDTDPVIASLRKEFIATAGATVLSLIDILKDGATVDGTVPITDIRKLKKELHVLRGQGGSFGFPSITALAAGLETHIAEADISDAGLVAGSRRYLSAMKAILDAGDDPGEEETASILSGLSSGNAANLSGNQSSA